MNNQPKDIDEYIAAFPPPVQEKLQAMRSTIQAAAPQATEAIKYAIPTFVLHGNLVHFAAFKNHIGFYATPTGHSAFEKELSKYQQGKGSVQFPMDEALPLALVTRIVKYRVKGNTERAKAKAKAATKKK